MLTVSDTYRAAVPYSRTFACRVDFYRGSTLVWEQAPVVAGTISADRGQNVRVQGVPGGVQPGFHGDGAAGRVPGGQVGSVGGGRDLGGRVGSGGVPGGRPVPVPEDAAVR